MKHYDRMHLVFGSNLAGRHGKGAAKTAVEQYGAIYGRGSGPQGRSYAIPTKDKFLKPLSLKEVSTYIGEFLDYARKHPEIEFKVTRVGCGLASFKDSEIAPLFSEAPDNCYFSENWAVWLPDKKFWGTY